MLKSSFLLLILFCALSLLFAEDQWLFQSEGKWNKEWKSGAWTYMETIPVERSRIAVIGGVFIPMFAGTNASVLDIGSPSRNAARIGRLR